MFRIEAVVLVLSILPLIMAIIFKTAVVPGRKRSMIAALTLAKEPTKESSQPPTDDSETNRYMASSIGRVSSDFESLYSTRLLFPAALLSFFYIIGLSLGVSCLLPNEGKCVTWLCHSFACFKTQYLWNPIFAVVGSYVFNMGVIVRRSFMADVTKNVFWSCANRVVFSVGISLPLHFFYAPTDKVQAIVCFAIAFFPRLFITVIRKYTNKALASADLSVSELDIQLVQGIDIWKEERLEEEGIESVQNLATADVLSLAVKTHYPIRTIVDWIDQAIFIQRFPDKFRALQEAGLPISSIELAWMSPVESQEPIAALIGSKIGVDGLFVERTMKSFYEDSAVRILWRLWQTGDSNN